MKTKDILKISSFPVLIGSLCCLGPIILVALGLSTVTFAASLTDTFYGGYRWVFRIVALILLTISVIFYLRRSKDICTIDQAKRRRNEIINIVAIVLITAVLGYIFFLYVVVHYIGVWFNIWQ